MIRSRLLPPVLGLLLAFGTAHAAPVQYKLDPNHTIVLAQWSHFGFSHPVANFGQVDGTLVYDADDVPASSVQVTLPLAGLQAFVPDFNEHLLSADFFDAEKHPNATFRSTKVEALGEGRFKITGELTIKGITRPVVLDAKLNKVGERQGRPAIGFDATATLKRSEFGLGLYVPNVSDEVKLTISTEATVPKPEPARP
ncbi:YceI family protein [Vulcaniibacterium gelatinicum]|uniref:YceI family protein n=1 Tax=Vulcaniibacterium gelatinicum TaxID=2598725 RepID=UPI0011CB3D76|nr:YceI family protein [Vulcaniibacterium gelatinicum]